MVALRRSLILFQWVLLGIIPCLQIMTVDREINYIHCLNCCSKIGEGISGKVGTGSFKVVITGLSRLFWDHFSAPKQYK